MGYMPIAFLRAEAAGEAVSALEVFDGWNLICGGVPLVGKNGGAYTFAAELVALHWLDILAARVEKGGVSDKQVDRLNGEIDALDAAEAALIVVELDAIAGLRGGLWAVKSRGVGGGMEESDVLALLADEGKMKSYANGASLLRNHAAAAGVEYIDVRWPVHRVHVVGNVTLNYLFGGGEGQAERRVRLYLSKDVGAAAIAWPANQTWVDAAPVLIDGRVTVAEIATIDAGASWVGWSGGSMLEPDPIIEGVAWNPSDKSAALLLDMENYRAEGGGGHFEFVAARAFGGRLAGKHRFSVRVDRGFRTTAVVNNATKTAEVEVGIGVATRNDSLAARMTSSQTGRGVRITKTGVGADRYEWGGVGYALPVTVADVITILADLDLRKIFCAVNGTLIAGGVGVDMPIAAAHYYPFISLCERVISTTGDAGLWRLLRDHENPYAGLWPEYQTWTS